MCWCEAAVGDLHVPEARTHSLEERNRQSNLSRLAWYLGWTTDAGGAGIRRASLA